VEDVLFSPEARVNILGAGPSTRNGLAYSKNRNGELYVELPGGQSVRGMADDALSWIPATFKNNQDPKDEEIGLIAAAMSNDEILGLLHARCGHPADETLARWIKRSPDKAKLIGPEGIKVAENCGICLRSKATRPPFHPRDLPHLKPGDRLYMDLQSFRNVPGGIKYQLRITDHVSRVGFIRQLPSKDAGPVLEELKAVIQFISRQSRLEPRPRTRVIYTDQGGEFTSAAMAEWLKSQGIALEAVPKESPQMNGQAERGHRTDNTGALNLLMQLPPEVGDRKRFLKFAMNQQLLVNNTEAASRLEDTERGARFGPLPSGVPASVWLLRLRDGASIAARQGEREQDPGRARRLFGQQRARAEGQLRVPLGGRAQRKGLHDAGHLQRS
jgi:hypothetical protein